jgi:hypothetical protein
MEHLMRRKDREKDVAFALDVLRDCDYATLATINTDGTPYCIPISPVLVDNTIYFHCAPEGQKLVNISKNNSVCISCVRHTMLVPEKFSLEYESAVATGTCAIVSDEEEKIMAIKKVGEKYAKSAIEHADTKIAKSLQDICVCKVDIIEITGKASVL